MEFECKLQGISSQIQMRVNKLLGFVSFLENSLAVPPLALLGSEFTEKILERAVTSLGTLFAVQGASAVLCCRLCGIDDNLLHALRASNMFVSSLFRFSRNGRVLHSVLCHHVMILATAVSSSVETILTDGSTYSEPQSLMLTLCAGI
jgi:hypothetical protein